MSLRTIFYISRKEATRFVFLVEVQKIAMMSTFLSSQPVFAIACYTGTIFNLQIVSLTQCISVKLGTFVWWSFLIIQNKSARILFNIFGDTVIQILESGKMRKSVRVPMLRQEELKDYSTASRIQLNHSKFL